MKYESIEDGWFEPIRKGYKFMCCDCGLVHTVNFKLRKHGKHNIILIKVGRDNRATGQARRWRK